MSADKTCSKCGKPFPSSKGFEMGAAFYCSLCFVSKAQEHRQLTEEDRNILRREVKTEMAAILDREVLRELIEDGCSDVVCERDPEPRLNSMVNEINRMAALAMHKELVGILMVIREEIDKQIDDLCKKSREIAEL